VADSGLLSKISSLCSARLLTLEALAPDIFSKSLMQFDLFNGIGSTCRNNGQIASIRPCQSG
jgi:hypothetical protein